MHKTLRIKVIHRKTKALVRDIHIMPLHRQPLTLVRVNLKVIAVVIPHPEEKTDRAPALIHRISNLYFVKGASPLHRNKIF